MKSRTSVLIALLVAVLVGCEEDLPVSGDDPAHSGPLSPPESLLPLEDQRCSVLGISMQWTSIDRAAKYELEIGDEPGEEFTPEYTAELSRPWTIVVLPPSFCGRRFAWRVRAVADDGSSSSWSSLSWFRLFAFEEDFAQRSLTVSISGVPTAWMVEDRKVTPHTQTIGAAPEGYDLHHQATFSEPAVDGLEWKYSAIVPYHYPPHSYRPYTDTLRLRLLFSADRTKITRAELSVHQYVSRSDGGIGPYDYTHYRRSLDLHCADLPLRADSYTYAVEGESTADHIAQYQDSTSIKSTSSYKIPNSQGGGWGSTLSQYFLLSLQSYSVTPQASISLRFQ